MPTPTIINGEEHFFVTTYEGNGGGQKVGKFVPFTDNGTIAKSLIFNDADNAYLQRTNDSGDRTRATISVWVKRSILGSVQYIFDVYDGSSTNDGMMRFNTDNTMSVRLGSASSLLYITNRTFKDTSKWYHFMLAVNTNESTAADRAKLYVDGERITSFSTQTNDGGSTTQFNYSSANFRIGSTTSGSYDFDGYIAEFNYIDGTVYEPSTFGMTDTSTGRWIPKTLTGISYGSNGHRLEFANNAGQTIGDDTSGQSNDFSVTNSVVGDITTDSPTQNHAILQGYPGGTLSEGNLKLVTGNSEKAHHNATLKPKSGKYYAEFTCNAMGRSEVGVVSNLLVPYPTNTTRMPATPDGSIPGLMYYGYNGKVYNDSGNGTAATYNTYSTNDIIGIALDLDNLTVQFFKNNTSEGTLSIPTSNYIFAMGDGATGYGGGWTANFGQKGFQYTPPTGFVALQQDNVPETSKGISGFTWLKDRDNSTNHYLVDSSRNYKNALYSNATDAEVFLTAGLRNPLKGGFEVLDGNPVNGNGRSFVSWNWVANGGTTASSTNSTVQVNSTANFSIVQYNGTGSDQNIGHGLGVKPDTIWVKNLVENSATGSGVSWRVWQKDVISLSGDPNSYIRFNSDDSHTAGGDSWGDTAPTSSVFTVGADVHTNAAVSGGTATYIAYCFANVEGYSRTGKYVGNGNSNGPFVYTGFKPALVIIKGYNIGNNWICWDNKRSLINPCDNVIYADLTQAETTSGNDLDFLSNGFKCRGTNSNYNGSYTYIYWAFAEHPFLGNGTNPVTGR